MDHNEVSSLKLNVSEKGKRVFRRFKSLTKWTKRTFKRPLEDQPRCFNHNNNNNYVNSNNNNNYNNCIATKGFSTSNNNNNHHSARNDASPWSILGHRFHNHAGGFVTRARNSVIHAQSNVALKETSNFVVIPERKMSQPQIQSRFSQCLQPSQLPQPSPTAQSTQIAQSAPPAVVDVFQRNSFLFDNDIDDNYNFYCDYWDDNNNNNSNSSSNNDSNSNNCTNTILGPQPSEVSKVSKVYGNENDENYKDVEEEDEEEEVNFLDALQPSITSSPSSPNYLPNISEFPNLSSTTSSNASNLINFLNFPNLANPDNDHPSTTNSKPATALLEKERKCHVCTYVNLPTARECEVCHNILVIATRPTSSQNFNDLLTQYPPYRPLTTITTNSLPITTSSNHNYDKRGKKNSLERTRMSILHEHDPDYAVVKGMFFSDIPRANIKGIIRLNMPTKLVQVHENYKVKVAKKMGVPTDNVTHTMFHGTTSAFDCDPERFLMGNDNFCKKGCGCCGIARKGNRKQYSRHSKSISSS